MDNPQHASLARTGSDGAVARISPRLRASWLRSEKYGVPADDVRPVFTGSLDTGSLLYECGQQVLSGLQTTLANEPISLMITDSQGLVLSRLCSDTAILRSLDRVNLAPGFYYAESNAGTNGIGLALADRAPSLVRAAGHYCTGLRGYTCAAVPVLDPFTGVLAGSVNLTTWSDQSSDLLLALAQAAAGNTTALMLARASGRTARPAPRGEVYRVFPERIDHEAPRLCAAWTHAVAEARGTLRHGKALAVVGETGAGKTTLAATACRELDPRLRLLNARPPAPSDADMWLSLWAPELGKYSTTIIVSGVDALPAWAATELAHHFTDARRPDAPPPYILTAESADTIPAALLPLIDGFVEAPPLRLRLDDILPLAHHFAHKHRSRDIAFTPAAARALTSYDWPENAKQLSRVVHAAASHSDVVDSHHLPPEVLTGSGHRLTRLQILERDEIVRALTEPGETIVHAAEQLGMGRATLYRKLSQYGINPQQLRS